jgi:lipopolysaccharide transport system ATP-binding protein
LGIDDEYGNRITHLNNEVTNDLFVTVPDDVNTVEVTIRKLPVMPGQYDVTIYSTVNGVLVDWIQKAFSFTVDSGDFYNTGRLIPPGQGSFLIEHNFKLQ